MKKFFRIISFLILLLVIAGVTFYFVTNKELPKGTKSKAADELATKMLNALEYKAFENTEIIEWTFRGNIDYKWLKKQGIVHVNWGNNKVTLNIKNPKNSEAFVDNIKVDSPKLIKKALNYFNNDSFWMVAPYKVFDAGTERSIVNENGKEALLVTYTSGGSTPGDSYLWTIDENGFPESFKMWVSIFPIGGVSATWHNMQITKSGMYLPETHKLSLFNFEIPVDNAKAYNPKADEIANKILAAIKHENYKTTQFIEWSFGDRRSYKWNKTANIVDVFWDSIQVNLPTKNIEKSTVFINNKKQEKVTDKLVKRVERMFNNDSFWLVAPHKLFDDNTYRYLKNENGTTKLFIKYTSGGSTPGDTYAWTFDENYVPNAYEMYIPSMKMKGKKATWEDWITTESGTLLPKIHTFGNNRTLSMGEVKGYN